MSRPSPPIRCDANGRRHLRLSSWFLVVLVSMAPQAGTTVTGLATSRSGADSLANISKHGIMPDVIDSTPAASLEVEWPNSGVRAIQGNELKPSQVKNQPLISFEAKLDKLYSLLMVDPDAPSRKDPKIREFCHFVVANIPGNEMSKGDTLVEYMGSAPPLGTGLHRYVFLLFEQKAKITSNLKVTKTMLKERPKFSARKFAKDNNLGEPIAANFFHAQHDNNAPTSTG